MLSEYSQTLSAAAQGTVAALAAPAVSAVQQLLALKKFSCGAIVSWC